MPFSFASRCHACRARFHLGRLTAAAVVKWSSHSLASRTLTQAQRNLFSMVLPTAMPSGCAAVFVSSRSFLAWSGGRHNARGVAPT
eukprot:7389407-Prymnesium_polylepis.3